MNSDSCVINRESLSIREKELKAKLFGTAATGFVPTGMSMPKTYVEEMEAKKVKQIHAAEIMPSDYMYRPQAESTTPMAMQQAQIKKMTKN